MALTLDEVKQELSNMKSHFQGGFSYSEQRYLEKINYLLFHKAISNRGCQDCYRDAYIIIVNKIKTMNELPKQSEYCLKAGIVIQPTFGVSKFYTLDIPADIAEEYLRKHPAQINQFQRYPEDWQERIKSKVSQEQIQTDMPEKAQKGTVEASAPVDEQPSMVAAKNAIEAKKKARNGKPKKRK